MRRSILSLPLFVVALVVFVTSASAITINVSESRYGPQPVTVTINTNPPVNVMLVLGATALCESAVMANNMDCVGGVDGRSDVVVFSALNNKAGQRIGTQLQVCSVANDEDRGTRGDGGCDASQAVTFAMRESNVETAREFTDYTPRSGSMQPGARAAGDEAITFHVVDSPEPGALLLVGLGLLSLAAVRVRV